MTVKPPVVVASDLTARSDRPFDRALALARAEDAPLVVVHVLEKVTPQAEEATATRARRVLDTLTHGLDVSASVILKSGSAPAAIAQAAQEVKASLIVVGAARFNNITDFFLGTAVDFLVRNATAPVLVVKRRPATPYDHLIVGTDFSQPSMEALLTGAALFPEARITLVHAYVPAVPSLTDGDAARLYATRLVRDEMAAFLERPEVRPLRSRLTEIVVDGPVTPTLTDFARQQRSPLMIIGAHGIGGVVQAMFGSRASELLASAPCDVLVVRKGSGETTA